MHRNRAHERADRLPDGRGSDRSRSHIGTAPCIGTARVSERTNSLTVAALIEAARHIGTAPCIGTARVSERTDSLTVAALIEAAPHIGTAPPTGAARVSKRSAGVYGTVPQSGYSAAGTLPLPFRPSQRIEARHSMRLRLLTGDPLAPLA